MKKLASVMALSLGLVGCGERAEYPVSAGMGPEPVLPNPKQTLVPTVDIAPAKGWEAGETPEAAEGLVVESFAADLDHPRWLYVLPKGDVLVAETNAPPRPEDSKGLRGWVMGLVMKWAGAGVPSADRITLLRDSDGDGKPETRSTFLDGLNSPFGMALVGNDFYVANTDAVLRFPYEPGQLRVDGPGVHVVDLPAGPMNHHWTKSLIASPDGTRLYVGVGSNSDHAEKGLEVEQGRAAIWEIDRSTGQYRIFASGLRNPVGLAIEPETGALWASVNERDELGSDLVPDYLTSVQDGRFYGWPFVYYGGHPDPRVEPQRPDLIEQAIAPDYALGPHTASLGLIFAEDTSLPGQFSQGAFIGQHGSWNRDPPSGYKVIFVPFREGRPEGEPIDVLTGFLDEAGNARGRPVGVALDSEGALLVADDVGNQVWRISPDASRQASRPGGIIPEG